MGSVGRNVSEEGRWRLKSEYLCFCCINSDHSLLFPQLLLYHDVYLINCSSSVHMMPGLGIKLISFPWTYPSRQIHWRSAHILHHRHILRQEPSTPLQRCSAYEGECRPGLYCGVHMCRSQELRRSAPPLRESAGRMPSRGWWLDSAGRR